MRTVILLSEHHSSFSYVLLSVQRFLHVPPRTITMYKAGLMYTHKDPYYDQICDP